MKEIPFTLNHEKCQNSGKAKANLDYILRDSERGAVVAVGLDSDNPKAHAQARINVLAEDDKIKSVSHKVLGTFPNEFTDQQCEEALNAYFDIVTHGGKGAAIGKLHLNNPDNKHWHGQFLDRKETEDEAENRRVAEGRKNKSRRQVMRLNSYQEIDGERVKSTEYLRRVWCQVVNEKIKKYEYDLTTDHRSFKRRGINKTAKRHQGIIGKYIEAKEFAKTMLSSAWQSAVQKTDEFINFSVTDRARHLAVIDNQNNISVGRSTLKPAGTLAQGPAGPVSKPTQKPKNIIAPSTLEMLDKQINDDVLGSIIVNTQKVTNTVKPTNVGKVPIASPAQNPKPKPKRKTKAQLFKDAARIQNVLITALQNDDLNIAVELYDRSVNAHMAAVKCKKAGAVSKVKSQIRKLKDPALNAQFDKLIKQMQPDQVQNSKPRDPMAEAIEAAKLRKSQNLDRSQEIRTPRQR